MYVSSRGGQSLYHNKYSTMHKVNFWILKLIYLITIIMSVSWHINMTERLLSLYFSPIKAQLLLHTCVPSLNENILIKVSPSTWLCVNLLSCIPRLWIQSLMNASGSCAWVGTGLHALRVVNAPLQVWHMAPATTRPKPTSAPHQIWSWI